MSQDLNALSPMPRESPPRRTALSIFLVLMFLFADLMLPDTLHFEPQLDEQQGISYATTYNSVLSDTYLDESNSTTNFNQSAVGFVGQSDAGSESRLLFEFGMNFTSSDTIHSATLNISCSKSGALSPEIRVYPASTSSWDSGTVSWDFSQTGSLWSVSGADGISDRGDWEPPYSASTNTTFSINVTSIAQQAASSNQSRFTILLSALNSNYECKLSEHPSTFERPQLTLVTSSTPAGDGGSVTSNFAANGQALMADDFILTAERNPTLSYSSLVGQNVEFQLSLDEFFKSTLDLDWHYSTMNNSFSTTSNSGSFTIPSSDAFDNGSKIYYRVRSIDSTDTLGNWSSTQHFLLPYHSVTDNGDGTASIDVDVDDMGQYANFIEDSYANQLSKNTQYGSSNYMETSVTSNKESLIHVRMNLGLLGLPSNATIVDAQLNLERYSSSNNAMLSMHEMSPGQWLENDMTWNRGTSSTNWENGGRDYASIASSTGLNGSQASSQFAFSFTDVLQTWVESNSNDSADFMITARGEYDSFSSTGTQSASFFTSDYSDDSKKPSVSIRYAWGQNSPLANVSLTGPIDGDAVWNQSGHNFTANLTPTLTWTPGSVNHEMVLQMATDEQFRDISWVSNTGVDNDFSPTDGMLNLTGSNSLEAGNMYFWRMAYMDSDGRYGPWQYSKFLVSSLESTWLGGDRYEFRLKHGNGTSSGLYPECLDTYIDSGTPSQNYNDESRLRISYNSYPIESAVLLNCNLRTNLLPPGYAVETAYLTMVLASNPSNSPTVAVWENLQTNWTDSGATWSSYDGTNSWATAGAKGAERSSLLDSVQIDSSSYISGDSVEWNVTLGVQNAMRLNKSADFILGILGVGSGLNRQVQLHPGFTSTSSLKPELRFVYVPGSNAVPSEPVPVTPLNGSWSIGTGVDQTPIKRPTLSWSFANSANVGGWAIQLDTSSTFESTSLQTKTSWNDGGFDVLNSTFTPTSDLADGTTWYWRVRAISATNQIGNWSNAFMFMLPNLTTWQTCPDGSCSSVELHHRTAHPSMNIPNFVDTYVIESGAGSAATYASSAQLQVGAVGFNRQAMSLIKIPLDSFPQPTNARVTNAQLNMYAEFGSSTGEPVAVRPVYQLWNSSANATTYDGVNNWSIAGGRNISVDIGPYVDVKNSVGGGWMTWDVSEAVQSSIASGSSSLSLAIYTSNNITSYVSSPNLIYFTSTEGLASQHPWLNLTWSNGTGTVPSDSGTNLLPLNNSISWNSTSHALLPEKTPLFTWSHPSPSSVDAWRIHIFEDSNDDMAGRYTFDSRVQSSSFDLTNLTFMPPNDVDYSDIIRWTVQPIFAGMIGSQSNSTTFYIPSPDAGELNSTHAWASFQEGTIIDSVGYPTVTSDTYIDQGSIYSNNGASTFLAVGRSPSSNTLRASTLMEIDFSSLPLPSEYEVTNASLTINVVNGYNDVYVTVSEMVTNWSESSSWAYPGNNSTSWVGAGAYHSLDSNIPENEGFWINSSEEFEINITSILQHAIERGEERLNIIIQPEEIQNRVEGTYYIASSENSNVAIRPKLTMTYEQTSPWSPNSPVNLLPTDGATLWNNSSPIPTGQDSFVSNWSSVDSNQTRWILCSSRNARMIDSICADSSANLSNSTDVTWDLLNSTATVDDVEKGDFWNYWRIRADQGSRIGHWSNVNKFRIPDSQGDSDGFGNYSVAIARGSVFTNTSQVPLVPDAEISSSVTGNLGSSSQLNLGTSASGTGESQLYFEFDLSSMPWPSAITPTSMLLNLYRTGVTGTTSTTVSVHACSSFNESSVTWVNNATCSPTEVTRSTLTLSPATGWNTWDLTSLAQSNIANGNLTMTILLKTVGTPTTSHAFYSGEGTNISLRPNILFEYVDNVGGILPPSQPTLISPLDGDVLYNLSAPVLQSDEKPLLTWSPVSGATGYIVTIANETGIYKFYSWYSSEINGTTFQFSEALDDGEVFTWWVQGVNQSIPGPSSPRWTFAIGSPNHADNADMTYTYTFQTGNEVAQFGHTNIRETFLSEAAPDMNFGDQSFVELGTYSGINARLETRITFGLDNGQVPLPSHSSIHSASLGLYLDSWESSGGANQMTFSVHRLLNSQWSQSSSTWNGSSSASSGAWGAPGLLAGVDYDATPITSFVETNLTENRWIWFDIGVNGMLIDNDNTWIILATPNRGTLLANFYSSENPSESLRPIILLNHTNVTSINLSPSSPTTDADTPVTFSYTALDHLLASVNVPVEWTASNGTISQTGVFTPYSTGQHTISACFGIICSSQVVTVTPGAPILLVATPETATITADEHLQINAHVVDQNGNIVPGQSITYVPSNGSMDSSTEGLFHPYASGSQTVQISWLGGTSPQQITVLINVETGIPANFALVGCQGTVPAGVFCDITHTLHDQFGNEISDLSEAGVLTWTTDNGNYSESTGQYFPDHVGQWYLNLSSTSGAQGSILIDVGHGQIASLELAASSLSITADEQVWINTTRIDVRGNRLPVLLLQADWESPQDSQLTPGQPAVWTPTSRGSKVIKATYETVTSNLTISVQEGAIVSLLLIVNDNVSTWNNFDMTSDEILDVNVKAYDQKDNRWIISANWSLTHSTWTSQAVLEQLTGDETTFVPYLASPDQYTITASYDDGTILHVVSINITVAQGDLSSVTVTASGPDGLSADEFNITSDDYIDFTSALTDFDTNPIDSSILEWTITNLDTNEVLNITDELVQNNMRWEASKTGNWSITASAVCNSYVNCIIDDTVTITVVHGTAVVVEAELDTSLQTAGEDIFITITGTDADGNSFAQDVDWFEGEFALENITSGTVQGTYSYLATSAGPHTLRFEAGSASGSVDVTVEAQRIVDSLVVELSATSVDQLGNFTVTVKAFDMYLNPIEVPPSAEVQSTGRADVLNQGQGIWNVITLDEGTQTITVTAGKVTEERTVEVVGNIGGFFKAGGPLYYVGAGLLGIVGVVILGLLSVALRNRDSDYDDDDDEYDDEDDDYSSSSATATPTRPEPEAEPEAKSIPQVDEDTSWQVDHRVDEDGTEWAEDENGTWWYRQEGDAEWGEWTD